MSARRRPDLRLRSRRARAEHRRPPDRRRHRLLRDRGDRQQPPGQRREGEGALPGRAATRASTRSSSRSASNRRLYTRALYESPYDNEQSFGATYGEHREALELDADAFARAARPTRRELGLVFFATAFDEESADLLDELDLPAFKIASGDLRNTPLLRHVASFGKPMIVSTGGATLEDVDRAVETIAPAQPGGLPAAVHRRLSRGRRGARARRDRDLPRALPRARDRALRPPGRDRDVARRVHARRARGREALHAEPHREGHRPRVLADARGDAEARARPRARPGRDRRRGQAAAADARRSRSRRWARSSSPRGRSPAGHVLAEGDLDREVAGRRRAAALRARRAARADAAARRSPRTRRCSPTDVAPAEAAPRAGSAAAAS